MKRSRIDSFLMVECILMQVFVLQTFILRTLFPSIFFSLNARETRVLLLFRRLQLHEYLEVGPFIETKASLEVH